MPNMFKSRKRMKKSANFMFPSFFAPSLGARKEQKKVLCMQFSVFDFYFLIWCLLTPIEKIYMTRGEREKAQQQILNTHKTATIEDRFSCNRTSMCALCTTREGERERELFYVHEATFSTPESLIPYIIFLCCSLLPIPCSLHYNFRPSYNK